ncbi:MAG: DUF2065 domain-containing protein [Desulfovibrio sp.]
MHIDWQFMLGAFGFALALEGAAYFLFAEQMPRMLAMLAEQGTGVLRGMGLVAMLLGLLLLYLVRC